MSQLLAIELACLQRRAILEDSSLIKSMKWCLKSLQALCQSSLPSIAPLLPDFASLCHTFLFSVFDEQTQIDSLYASLARLIGRMDLFPVVDAAISSVISLLSKSSSDASLRQFYSSETLDRLLRCLQLRMFPLSPSQLALLDEDPESSYWTLTNSCYRQKLFALCDSLYQVCPQLVIQAILDTMQNLPAASEAAIYGLLCLFQRGGSMLSTHIHYKNVVSHLLLPLLREGVSSSLAVECVSVVTQCFYLFDESSRASLVSSVIEVLHHSNLAVRLAGVGCLTELLEGSPTSVSLILRSFEEIMNHVVFLYRVDAPIAG